MKKAILLMALAIYGIGVTAQENGTWRIGIQTGWHANKSRYSGGMSDANARFHQNKFGAVALDIICRYDFNRHWKIESGLNFNRTGFEFVLAENYSFLNRRNRYSRVKATIGLIEIPMMVSYKFNPDCKNKKWFLSAGVASVFVPEKMQEDKFNPNTDGSGSSNYLSASTISYGGNYLNARVMVGREKVFKTGNILSAALIWNVGFKEIAQTTVNYTVDGKLYNHNFSNNGNFIGLRVAYYFSPLNNRTKKMEKAKANLITSMPSVK